MTRVLITGAGGFVGHHFLEHVLTNTDWNVTCTDSFRHKGKIDRITEVLQAHDDFASSRPWFSERTQIVTQDLTVPFSNQAIDRMGEIDYIVAFASESHVDRSISDPVPFAQNNVNVMLNTLELTRQVKPKALILVSTDEVYGPVEATDYEGHPEWDTIMPSNPYSASKAAQEAFAFSYWRTYGIPLQIVNCMNMIGERQDPEKFVPLVLSKVLKGETVQIHAQDENHIGTRHYLHARNLADGILFLLNKTRPHKFGMLFTDPDPSNKTGTYTIDRPDRYNIACPDRIDNLTLAKMIAEDIGQPLKYKLEDFHTTRPGHDPHYGLSGKKMADLGWTPPVPFRESLKKTVKWTLAHPHWML
jgi:dTDP-glucose 4,6-dehydratase